MYVVADIAIYKILVVTNTQTDVRSLLLCIAAEQAMRNDALPKAGNETTLRNG